jgi:O-antigen/teichoic acid export membrane protein
VRALVSSRIGRGVGANVFAQAAMAAVQLAAVPIFATHWGLGLYGLWLMLFTVPSYLSLADFGFATAAANSMTASVAKGDHAGALATFQGAWISVTMITLALAGAAWGIVHFLPMGFFGEMTQAGGDTVRRTLLELILYGLVSLQSGIFVGAFRCQGLYARGVFFNVLILLAENGAAFVTAALGGGIADVALAYLVARLIGVLFVALQLRLSAPWLMVAAWRFSWAIVRRLASPAIAVMAVPAAQATFLQGLVLIVGAVAGPAAVPAFTTVRTLSRLGVQAATTVNLALMPEFTMAVARGDLKRKADLLALNLVSSAGVLIPLFVLITALGTTIVPLWTHGTVRPGFALVLTMSLVMLLNGLWWPLANLVLALNRQAIYSYFYLASALAAVALAWPLVLALGATGAALSLLALDAVMLVYAAVQADRHAIVRFAELRAAAGAIRAGRGRLPGPLKSAAGSPVDPAGPDDRA